MLNSPRSNISIYLSALGILDIGFAVSVQADFAKLPADFINDAAGMPCR